MLRSCRYCGRIHDIKYICPKKPKKKRKQYDTEAVEFRRRNAWKEMSLRVRERDNHLCQLCLYHGISEVLTMRRIQGDAVSVHHITPVAEDTTRALDPFNLITLCSTCHRQADDGEIDRKLLYQLADESERRASG